MGKTFPSSSSTPVPKKTGTASEQDDGTSIGLHILFGAAFFLFGCLALYVFTLKPMTLYFKSSNWVSTPCTIIKSQLEKIDTGEGYSYKIDITYEYLWNSQTLTSDRYDFLSNFYASGKPDKQAVVNSLPVGTTTTCLVDPNDPNEAVLSRQLGWTVLTAFFPVLFIGVSLSIIFIPIIVRRMQARRKQRGDTKTQSFNLESILFTLIWNAISWFAFLVVLHESGGDGWWIGPLLAFIFPLAGIVLIVQEISQVRDSRKPRASITLEPTILHPGEPLELHWVFQHPTGKVSRLTITLEGIESSVKGSGMAKRTYTSPFMILPLADTSDPAEIAAGQVNMTLPADLMHSLLVGDNTILWKICMRGVIPNLQTTMKEFDVIVLPADWARQIDQHVSGPSSNLSKAR